MARQGYHLALTSDQEGWRAIFLHRDHLYRPWVGQVMRFYPTPGQAVRDATWEALSALAPDPAAVESPP